MDPFITIHHPTLRLEATQRESTLAEVWEPRGWKRGELPPKPKPKPRTKKTTESDNPTN